MPRFILSFSGIVKKPQVKQVGDKQVLEFQVCRKNYGKSDAEATFTWVRVSVFGPQPRQIEQAYDGAFITGSGEFTLRSYEKDGVKRQSAEVRCTSFDIDSPKPEPVVVMDDPPPKPAPRKPSPVADDGSGPPF